jgi:hypothetical protein
MVGDPGRFAKTDFVPVIHKIAGRQQHPKPGASLAKNGYKRVAAAGGPWLAGSRVAKRIQITPRANQNRYVAPDAVPKKGIPIGQ